MGLTNVVEDEEDDKDACSAACNQAGRHRFKRPVAAAASEAIRAPRPQPTASLSPTQRLPPPTTKLSLFKGGNGRTSSTSNTPHLASHELLRGCA